MDGGFAPYDPLFVAMRELNANIDALVEFQRAAGIGRAAAQSQTAPGDSNAADRK